MLVFSEQNIIKDPPFSKLDLISCRNLLIYMNGELQKKLIPLFHYALCPGGFLFLGTSETVGEFGDLFAVLDRKSKLYQRKEDFHGVQRAALGRFLPPRTAVDTALPPAAGKTDGPVKVSLRALTEQALLQQVAPAAALVNDHGDILYVHGHTGPYLELSPGEVGINNILNMVREGLRHDLSKALHKAAAGREIVRCPGLRVKTNGDMTAVNLSVHPIATVATDRPGEPLYLVVLEQSQPFEPERTQKAAALQVGEGSESLDTADTDGRIAELKQELRAKEEYLQTTNEELRSSNEEMQSVNEELQSTNEELETSKEELQSVNEELATVNAELEVKVADLSRANNDMKNLLAGTGIGTVFVDHGLRILRFTPAATRIINLIQSDIGRPVGHILSNLSGYDNLLPDTQAVLDTLAPKELEVRTLDGTWYTMRILPYRTLDNVIEGAVITFVDITEAKKTAEALRGTQQRLRLAQEAANAGTWEWNLLTNENTWSEELWPLYGLEPNSLEPSLETWLQSVHPDDRARVEQVVREASSKEMELNAEWRVLDRDGKERWLMCRGKPFRDAYGRMTHYAGIVIDITDRKRAEEALRHAFDQIKTLRGIVPICTSCKKIRDDRGYWNQVEVYVRDHSEAEFSHSLCPECIKKLYPELEKEEGSAPENDGGAQ